jgi:hypothetical protein
VNLSLTFNGTSVPEPDDPLLLGEHGVGGHSGLQASDVAAPLTPPTVLHVDLAPGVGVAIIIFGDFCHPILAKCSSI